jgi:hypothetical protein
MISDSPIAKSNGFDLQSKLTNGTLPNKALSIATLSSTKQGLLTRTPFSFSIPTKNTVIQSKGDASPTVKTNGVHGVLSDKKNCNLNKIVNYDESSDSEEEEVPLPPHLNKFGGRHLMSVGSTLSNILNSAPKLSDPSLDKPEEQNRTTKPTNDFRLFSTPSSTSLTPKETEKNALDNDIGSKSNENKQDFSESLKQSLYSKEKTESSKSNPNETPISSGKSSVNSSFILRTGLTTETSTEQSLTTLGKNGRSSRIWMVEQCFLFVSHF